MTGRSVRELAVGLGHPQGPSIEATGGVVFAETYRGLIRRYSVDDGLQTIADVGGGPNATLVAPDGTIWFTQNGGQAGAWRSPAQRDPALCAIFAGEGGAITTVATQVDGADFLAPHDLAIGPDGSVYMTDSGTWDPDERSEPGRLIRRRPSGEIETIAELGRVYPSGVTVEEDGAVVWAECYTNRIFRMAEGGEPHLVVTLPEEQMPESVKSGPDGTLWIAGLFAAGIVVLDRHGRELDVVHTGGLPLNCVHTDTTLYVADLGDYDDDAAAEGAQLTGRLLEVHL